jgi:protein SCO1/2
MTARISSIIQTQIEAWTRIRLREVPSVVRLPILALTLVLVTNIAAHSHDAHQDHRETRLPVMGPAPDFTLIGQDGREFSLSQLRGKAVAVTFIFASCADTCPLLTDKMARVQDELASDFGTRVAFVSITVDPIRDTPAVMNEYAKAFKANPAGWHFLSGTLKAIEVVESQYGIYVSRENGTIDHTFLTSLVDPEGNLRVQYLGYRFDPDEFKRDLLSLAAEVQ